MRDISEFDENSILARETFDELFEIKDNFTREERHQSLIKHARKFGKSCEDAFKAMYNAYAQDLKEKNEADAAQRRIREPLETKFGYFADGHELRCSDWITGENDIYRGEGKNYVIACHHPILITRIFNNVETKRQKVELAYKIAGEWNTIIVDKGIIAAQNKIVSLAENGINATSENAKALIQYLSDLEAFNIDIIERRSSTSKFGWIGNEFVPYCADYEFDNKENFQELFSSVSERGSYDAWMTCVKGVRASGRKEPLVYMAASFASILLCKLDVLSFIVNLWEETGRGKTTSMMIAASVWGEPVAGKYMTDSTSTVAGFEVRSDVLNHLPLMVDDLSKVKEGNQKDFSDLIYSWSSGKGKDRSNQRLGLNRSSTWNNITLTSYERPLATEDMKGGAINRVLDFQIEPGDIFTKETGNATARTLKKNYGFAGKMFVELVRDIGIKAIKELQDDFLKRIDQFCEDNNADKEDKQKLPLSVLLVADKLATDNIFKDGIYLDFAWCVNQLKSKEEVSEPLRAYRTLMDEIVIHAYQFMPDWNEGRGELWGKKENGYVYIVPEALNRISQEHNFSKEQLLSWLKRQGLLLHDQHKNQKTTRLRQSESAVKVYAIKILEEEEETEDKKNAAGDKGDFLPVPDQMELPFD